MIVLEPKVFGDDRSFFFESFNERTFKRVAGELFDLQDWKIDVHAVGQKIAALANDQQRYRKLLDRVPAAAARLGVSEMLRKYEETYRDLLTTPSVVPIESYCVGGRRS